MSYELTIEDKINVIENRIRNICLNEYNLYMSKIEEESKSSPDKVMINNLEAQIRDTGKQIAALQEEIKKLLPES
jgi:hypothetical protein